MLDELRRRYEANSTSALFSPVGVDICALGAPSTTGRLGRHEGRSELRLCVLVRPSNRAAACVDARLAGRQEPPADLGLKRRTEHSPQARAVNEGRGSASYESEITVPAGAVEPEKLYSVDVNRRELVETKCPDGVGFGFGVSGRSGSHSKS